MVQIMARRQPGGRLNIKMSFYDIGIPMLKIRRSHDRLIFNMVIPILGKDGLYIEIGPRRLAIFVTNSDTVYWRLSAPLVLDQSQIDILFAFDFSKQKYNDISYDYEKTEFHYSVVIMGTMASQINSLTTALFI